MKNLLDQKTYMWYFVIPAEELIIAIYETVCREINMFSVRLMFSTDSYLKFCCCFLNNELECIFINIHIHFSKYYIF